MLPFGLVAFVWQLGIITALYGVVRISQLLLPGDSGGRPVAMLWTAVGMWVEPLRSTFDYGQINLLLVLAVLYAVYSARWWVSGLLVGLAAGVKLTPAVSALYFVGVRRWNTAVFSAVVFVGTVAVSALVVGDQTGYYFTELLGDPVDPSLALAATHDDLAATWPLRQRLGARILGWGWLGLTFGDSSSPNKWTTTIPPSRSPGRPHATPGSPARR